MVTSSSNIAFSSSNDILRIIQQNPHIVKCKPERQCAIVAAIISGLSVASGVALIVVSGGATTPGLVLSSSLFISTGVSGLQNSITGMVNNDFDWSQWATITARSAGLTLITFSAGYGAGYLTGLSLIGKGFTNLQIKAYGAVAGKIAGATVRTSAYIIISRNEDNGLDFFSLVMEGISGASSGGYAGFVGAKGAIIKITEEPLMIRKILIKTNEGTFTVENGKFILNESEEKAATVGGKVAHSRTHCGVNNINPRKPIQTLFLTVEDQDRFFHQALTSIEGRNALAELLETPDAKTLIESSSSGVEILYVEKGVGEKFKIKTVKIICYARKGEESGEILIHPQTTYPTK